MCPLRPTGQPFNISTWSPSGPPSLSARMPLLALALTLALALFTPLPTCHRAHVPPRGKAAQVGSALRDDLAIPRNKKAGDQGFYPPAPGLCFCPPYQRVNLSTCQLVLPSGPPANSSTGQLTRRLLSPCHRAHVPPRGDFRRRATPSAPARDTGSRRADPASPARRRSPPPALLRLPRATPSGCGRCALAGPCACRRTDW